MTAVVSVRDVLEIEDLEVRYGSSPALRGVSVRVAPGEIVAVVGPNGAGKSTLLLTIAGVIRPDHGRIRVDGESVVRRAPEAIARSGVALVPERRHIFSRLTVEENLRVPPVKGKALRTQLDLVYELFPILRQFRERTAGYLSGGQQQQLAIARALITQPRILLLDEPSLGLAPATSDALFEALRTYRERGATIFVVEQRLGHVLRTADRAYVLVAGQIRLEVPTSDPVEARRQITASYFAALDHAPPPLS